MLNTHGLERKGYIIPQSDAGLLYMTLDEWLIYWSWQYFINQIDVRDYIDKINSITPDTPGALDSERWQAHTDYLMLLRKK